MACFYDLPSELVEKIMLWAPADSLVQFRFVNKFYHTLISSLIKDPEFVAKHLIIAKNKSLVSLLCYTNPSPNVDHRLATHPLLNIIYNDVETNVLGTVVDTVTLPVFLKEGFNNVMYHCDGLLLLVNNHGRMMLCNPSLKESVILPKPMNVGFEAYPNVGFELDSKDNKYKCVAIWLGEDECQVGVYTVGSDHWREIKMSEDIVDAIADTQLCNGLCWGGVCYWMVVISDEAIFILSFDMSNDKFRLVNLPNFEALGVEEWALEEYSLRFAVWNDSVVLCLTPNGDNTSFIFMMKKDAAGACSWTEYRQIGPLEKHYSHLLTFWKNNEILMKVVGDDRSAFQLTSYNIGKQKLRNVVYDLDSNMNIFYNSVCFYVKSLISVKVKSSRPPLKYVYTRRPKIAKLQRSDE
ncbi:hypothetical protein CsatB_030883 [Cannabis sativa]